MLGDRVTYEGASSSNSDEDTRRTGLLARTLSGRGRPRTVLRATFDQDDDDDQGNLSAPTTDSSPSRTLRYNIRPASKARRFSSSVDVDKDDDSEYVVESDLTETESPAMRAVDPIRGSRGGGIGGESTWDSLDFDLSGARKMFGPYVQSTDSSVGAFSSARASGTFPVLGPRPAPVQRVESSADSYLVESSSESEEDLSPRSARIMGAGRGTITGTGTGKPPIGRRVS